MKFIKRIIELVLMVLLPLKSTVRKKLLYKNYIYPLQVKGKNIKINNPLRVIRSKALVLGSDVIIHGKSTFDARAGIMIGDGAVIEKKCNLITTKTINNSKTVFDPIIIGRGKKINNHIAPGTVLSGGDTNAGLFSFSGQLCFILSTGRSGSKAIAQLINSHPDGECLHDAFSHLNIWSCDLLYNNKSSDEVKQLLMELYCAADFAHGKVHGQSDQKLSVFVPLLHELFPNAKFIWLIRKADSFINSSYPRGWFRNVEFGYEPHAEEFLPAKSKPSLLHATHRPNGYKMGIFMEQDWKGMTAFERNCWYWTWWNQKIENDLNNIPKELWMRLNLSDLKNKTFEIQKFLGLEPIVVEAKKVNAATYKKLTSDDWLPAMKKIYEKQCVEAMDRWFN